MATQQQDTFAPTLGYVAADLAKTGETRRPTTYYVASRKKYMNFPTLRARE